MKFIGLNIDRNVYRALVREQARRSKAAGVRLSLAATIRAVLAEWKERTR